MSWARSTITGCSSGIARAQTAGAAALRAAAGSLDRVERAIKVTGFVASAPGFVEQPKVIDAASNLLGKVFGEAGRHARSAVGVAMLPRGVPVEIEFVFALKES